MLVLGMKYFLVSLLAIFCVVNIPSRSFAEDIASSKVISLSADLWMPYNGEPNSEKPGYVIEIAKAVFEPRGFVVEYQVAPWSRSIRAMMAGQITGIVAASQREAPGAIYPVESIANVQYCFFTLPQSDWKYVDFTSLKSIRLALIEDYSYTPIIDAYVANNRTITPLLDFSSGEDALILNIKKLQAKRVDAVITPLEVLQTQLQSMDLEIELFRNAGCTAKDPLYIAFSPKDPRSKELAQILSSGIQKLRKSGKLSKILSRYSVSDWN